MDDARKSAAGGGTTVLAENHSAPAMLEATGTAAVRVAEDRSGATRATPAVVQPAVPRRRLRERIKRVVMAPVVFFRYVLRKLLYVVVRLIAGGWRHPIVTLLLIVGVGLGYQGYNEYIKDDPPPPPAEVFDIAEAIPPAPVAMDFLAAQRDFDGARIWNELLTEEAKNEMLGQGISLQTFSQQLQSVHDSGILFGDSAYIGGKTGSEVNFYFYVTKLRSVTGQEADIYQVLWIDPTNGKLMRIDSPIQN